jgi:hypothetical protein
MDAQQLSLIAGMISTAMFASSNVPMLIKAFRTRDFRSYSFAHIVMSNVGNAVHWIYIAALPWGPIWFLHAFYTITTALMLIWYLQACSPRRAKTRSSTT